MNTCEISKPYKNSSASKENGVVILLITLYRNVLISVTSVSTIICLINHSS